MRQQLIDQLTELLRAGLTQADVLLTLGEIYPADDYAVEIAREETNDDLEIDDMPIQSKADDGTWVSAWIWVPNKEVEEEA